MIDVDATLEDMLAAIGWQPQDNGISLSDPADERVYRSPQCHLSLRWRPSELDIMVRLFQVYLGKFPQVSFDSIIHDLVRPVKRGKGNAIKRGHGNDREKSILFENYFTKDGVVVAVTDQGKGFDYRQTVAMLEGKTRYFNNHGSGFRTFAKCRSTIGYRDGGRTLLVQYRVDRAPPASPRECYAAAGEGSTPVDIVESLPKKRYSFLYNLARCEPELLRAVWKNPKFVATYIHPALPDGRRPAPGTAESSAELVDADEESATIRYQLGDDAIVAKFYRRGEQGAMTHAILCAAWHGGLGPGQLYRVPQPLAYYPERRLLLTTTVDGIPLKQYMDGDADEFVRACGKAARWLLRFHATPLPAAGEGTGALDGLDPGQSADAAPPDGQNAAERNQGYAGLLEELWAELEHCAPAAHRTAHAIVPIHGDFRPENVLFTSGATAAINFDRSGLGDPASDVACFTYSLWKKMFKVTLDWQHAKIAANAFLAEYGARKPEHLASVPYYWGERILDSLEYLTWYKLRSDVTESFDHVVAFHVEQFKVACRCATGARGARGAQGSPVSGKAETGTAVESNMNAGSGE